MQNIIFSGSSNIALARDIAGLLKWPLGRLELSKFSDGETYVNITDNVADKNVFVLQSCNHPCNENLMELLIILDAIKQLKPIKITAILPFYAYRRQEKNTMPGESITARLVARLLEAAGADRVLTIDIHTAKILDFFKIPAQNLEATPLFEKYFKNFDFKNLIVMAPDRGALADVKQFAKKINARFAWANKKRDKKHDKITSMVFHGDVRKNDVLIIDDEINTAGTLCEAAKLLKKAGAKNIYACCTHAVFSGPAIDRLKNSSFEQIIITNTICLPQEKTKLLGKKLKTLSVAPVLARALKDINEQ